MSREIQALLPIKHTQADLFICDMFDTWKDDQGSMEHPVFSLSTKPDHRERKYFHNGNTIEIMPSSRGLATIHDKDILLYLTSQLMHEINTRQKEGKKNGQKEIEAPSKRVRFIAYDFFVLTNRATTKLSYERLESALDRLSGTRIKTNIKTNGKIITENFGIIDAFGIIREDQENPDSRMIGVQVKLSDWFYNSIIGNQVLTINKDYFRLRKPLERRIYELSRKHCGHQQKWKISLDLLKKKSGSSAPLYEFRRMVKKIIDLNHMPDYQIYFDQDQKDLLIIRPRVEPDLAIEHTKRLYLKAQTYENARKVLNRNFDVYAVESEWLGFWNKTGCPELKSPDGAFINFCKKKAEWV